MARVTDEQQSKGNLGGPDLFLAPVGRLEAEKISKYTCNTCEKEFEGSPNIEFENPNEEVAENLVLVERGKYLCNECGSTIAEYRDFRKPDEQVDVGLANPVVDTLEKITPPMDQEDPPNYFDYQQESVQSEMTEPIPSGGTFRSIFGMDVFDESAKRIGKAKQVGVDSNQELVLLVSDASGNDINISWSRIGTVGEVIFLGKSDKTDVKVEQTLEVGSGSRCSSCNFDNKPDSKFCESCGTQL